VTDQLTAVLPDLATRCPAEDPARPEQATYQAKYQVRFDHGVAGARRIAPGAHVVVVADALDGHGTLSSTDVLARVAELADDGADVVLAASGSGSGSGSDSEAIARLVLERQAARGDRAVVAVVAAGAVDLVDGGEHFRPAVEDQLVAGSVVDALAAAGVDSSSPEAALVCAATVSLRGAVSHLTRASSSAVQLR